MTSDPAPAFTDPDEAMDHLAEWGRQYKLLMARRAPLVKAALTGPLSAHGHLRQAEDATGLTAQTLRRLKLHEVPLAGHDHSSDVDWDAYADYLETLGTVIQEQLDALPSGQSGRRAYTTDDLRARLLARLADRLRETEISDVGLWGLTVELRQEASEVTVFYRGAGSQSDACGGDESRAERMRVYTEVADQITAYRLDGPAASHRLDAAVLARAHADLAPPPADQLIRPHGRTPHA